MGINPSDFFNYFKKNNIDFFTGGQTSTTGGGIAAHNQTDQEVL